MVLEQRAKNWAYLRKESAFKWRLIKTLSHKRCSSNLKEWLFQRCSTFPKYLEELAWKSEYCNFRQLIWYFLIKRSKFDVGLNARPEIWILNKLLIYLYILHIYFTAGKSFRLPHAVWNCIARKWSKREQWISSRFEWGKWAIPKVWLHTFPFL